MTAHPDKGGSEAKMAQVNEAYEVLSNPGMYHSTSDALSNAFSLIVLVRPYHHPRSPSTI
jgi:hypothetical protein